MNFCEQTVNFEDGRQHILSIGEVPLKCDIEEMTPALGIGMDVTDYKHVEADPIKTKEKADQASRAKNRFLSNICREIKTPMNSILRFVTLLEESQMDANQQAYIDHIKTSANILLEHFDQILNYGSMESTAAGDDQSYQQKRPLPWMSKKDFVNCPMSVKSPEEFIAENQFDL